MTLVKPPPITSESDPTTNITVDSFGREAASMAYGIAVYEVVMCLNIYFAICNATKLKTAIFRLISVAVFPLMISTAIEIYLHLNSTGPYPFQTEDSKIHLYCINIVLMVVSKFGYYTAGTLRSRALLSRFPRLLYVFYAMLAITIISNLILLIMLIQFFAIIYTMTPENFQQKDRELDRSYTIYRYHSSFTTIFDMIYANILIVSFMYPIFTAMGMKFGPALRAMIKLGDVRKAIVSSASSILFVAFVFITDFPQLSIATVAVWLNTQNTLFLRLSYFTSSELLSKHGPMNFGGRQMIPTNEKSKDTTSCHAEVLNIAEDA